MTGTGRKIQSIEAQGILGEFSYLVDYPAGGDADRLRLIYAPNGRGKTNFLRAVSAALTPTLESLQTLIEIPFVRLHITFSGGASILIDRGDKVVGQFKATAFTEPDAEGLAVDVDPVEFGARVYRRMLDTRQDFADYSKAVLLLSPGAVFIGDDRLSFQASDEPRDSTRGESSVSRRQRGSVSRLLETVERMLTQQAISGLSQEGHQAWIYSQITRTTLEGSSQIIANEARTSLESKIKNLIDRGSPLERYGLFSMRQVHDISDQIANARANARNLPAVHTVLMPYFDSLQDQITALGPAQKIIDTYVTSVNQFLDRKELKFTASRGITLVGRDGRDLEPESLSSGERHLLLLLSQAVLATTDRPLVIIDEPELSLGIEWQRDLLPELLRCSASGPVQFLVASHSLQVMNAVPREDIVQPGDPK